MVKADQINGQSVPARDNLSPTVEIRMPPCIPADLVRSLRQLVPVNVGSSTAPSGRPLFVYHFDFHENFDRWSHCLAARSAVCSFAYCLTHLPKIVDGMAYVDAE